MEKFETLYSSRSTLSNTAIGAGRAPNALQNSSLFSFLSFGFVDEIIREGYNRPLVDSLEKSDIWKTHDDDNMEENYTLFMKHWNSLKSGDNPLFHSLFQMIKKNLLLCVTLQFFNRVASMGGPLLLQALLIFILTPSDSNSFGYGLAVAMFAVAFTAALSNSHSFQVLIGTWTRIRGLMGVSVFRKSMRLSSSGRGKSTVGEITNFMSSDADKIGQMMMGLGDAVMAPLQFIVILIFLYYTVGAATFAGLGAMIFMFPLMGLVMSTFGTLTKEKSSFADIRVRMINEVLQGIRVVRFYAWEPSFLERITTVRSEEIALLKKLNFNRACLVTLFMSLPPIVALTTFSVYSNTGNELTIPQVFRAMAFFNMLRWTLLSIPTAVTLLISGNVSIKRVESYLLLNEVESLSSPDESIISEYPIVIESGNFSWSPIEDEGSLILKDINVKVKAGSLTAVVGSVGSGKSSLIMACLGEMQCSESTKMFCHGPVGYVSQTAWIQNMSVRDNILFGLPYDQIKYQKVVESCALVSDFWVLPARDFTEIGDRGVNLSGGQKQRIALARAIYSDSDVLLLDDPFSAVDATVGAQLFSCLKTLCLGKTILLVTNHVHLLRSCDYVYVLSCGRVDTHGTFESLCKTGYNFQKLEQTETNDADIEVLLHNPVVEDLVPEVLEKPKSVLVREKSNPNTNISAAATPSAEISNKTVEAGLVLVQDEEKQAGTVSWDVYIYHISQMGGWPFFIIYVCVLVLGQAFLISTDVWIGFWSSNQFNQSNNWYIGYYGLLAGISSIMFLLRGLIVSLSSAKASYMHHKNILDSVLHGTSRFFDATPCGRILNRFSKDTDEIDNQVPNLLDNSFGIFLMIMGNMVAICLVLPYFTFVVIVVFILFYYIQKYYSKAALQLQRIEAVTRSPLYNHFSESLNGVAVIRAFRASDRCAKENQNATERNITVFLMLRTVFRWAILRFELCNSLIQFSIALFVVSSRGILDPAYAGVALNLVLGFGGILGIGCMIATELENKMNNVERVMEYTTSIEQDRPWSIPEVDDKLPVNWPLEGKVEFENVTVRYREALEPALKNVSVTVESKLKLGVAGRTGSGKSTLMLCLFRMYELSTGKITIDGVDISTLGLHALRKRLAIIPQDPFMFSGKLRDNLDPFSEYQEDEIWNVLSLCNLKDLVEELPDKLEAPVTEYGGNFSQGQRQLVCMARALLRNPSILVLDEATSSVDHATDELIQQTVRSQFKHATVLTIAHRLNTIMDADRILILNHGEVNQYDTPSKLLENEGIFSAMYNASLQSHNSL